MGSIFKKIVTITASSTQTLSTGRVYGNASFWRISGTGSGAIKLMVKGGGANTPVYMRPDPNRIPLLATSAPQKLDNVLTDAFVLWASGTTAATVRLYINAWEPRG